MARHNNGWTAAARAADRLYPDRLAVPTAEPKDAGLVARERWLWADLRLLELVWRTAGGPIWIADGCYGPVEYTLGYRGPGCQ